MLTYLHFARYFETLSKYAFTAYVGTTNDGGLMTYYKGCKQCSYYLYKMFS